MSKQEKTIPSNEKTGLLAKVLGRKVGKAALGANVALTDNKKLVSNTYPIQETLPEITLLDKGDSRRIQSTETAFAVRKLGDGTEARLLGIAFTGNSVLGVVGIAERPDRGVTRMLVSELAMGEKLKHDTRNTSDVLRSIDLPGLREVNAAGFIPNFERFTIGRDADVHLDDLEVSRLHLNVEVTPESVTLTDTSSNGTKVLLAEDIMRYSASPEVEALYTHLETTPQVWSPDFAGVSAPA